MRKEDYDKLSEVVVAVLSARSDIELKWARMKLEKVWNEIDREVKRRAA